MNHVELGQLVDLARGLLEDGEAAALRAHLDECGRCRAALDRLSLVVRAARAASSLPATAVREANELAAAPPSPDSGATAARLVFDDVAEPLTAGVRGIAQDRHLLFEADHWAIDLRVVRSDRALSITGQLVNVRTGGLVMDDSTELKGDPEPMVRARTRIFAERVVRTIREQEALSNK